MRRRRLQAGRDASRAVDVIGRTAPPAHDVVVVVADTRLEPARAARGWDAAHQPGLLENAKPVIDALHRYRPKALARRSHQVLGVVMARLRGERQEREA